MRIPKAHLLAEAASSAPPGKISLLTVSAEEPSSKPIAECAKQAVCLTLHRGEEDDRLLQVRGPCAFRRERIPDLCQQAFSQGGLLTREDLAYRIFFVGTRTISRDLAWCRRNQPQVPLPLRSTVYDIGPLLTHRVQIVRIMRHSPSAITNHVGTFTRRAQLAEQKLQVGQIAFLLRRGPGLIRQYLALLDQCRADANLAYHLDQLLRLGQVAGEKNPIAGGHVLAKTDFVRKKYAPLLDRSLPRALAHFLGREFPRLGGDRFLTLAAELILDFLADHLRAPEAVGHGQILWLAVSRDDPPARGKPITHTDLVPVVLALHAPEDVEAILRRQTRWEQILQKSLRLCQQAYRQGGLLGNCDLAALLNVDDSTIATLLADHERRTETLVPRRATLHDVGTGLTHKRLICWKRFAQGKPPEQVARETYHSLEAVDRYLAQFDRVRHCRQQNMQPDQIAYILRCSRSLVDQYLEIDQELEQHRAP